MRTKKKPLPVHGGKRPLLRSGELWRGRQVMAPGGQLLAENDRPWGISDGF